MNIKDLPGSINVRTIRNKKTGVLVAEILDFDISTEADSIQELVFNVNDLIFTYFDVPKELRTEIRYSPSFKNETEPSFSDPVRFKILMTPALSKSYLRC